MTAQQPIEAVERRLLGCFLLDPQAIELVSYLRPDDFSRPAHWRIYKAILTVYRERGSVDLLLLCVYLQERKELDAVGGRVSLAGLVTNLPETPD